MKLGGAAGGDTSAGDAELTVKMRWRGTMIKKVSVAVSGVAATKSASCVSGWGMRVCVCVTKFRQTYVCMYVCMNVMEGRKEGRKEGSKEGRK